MFSLIKNIFLIKDKEIELKKLKIKIKEFELDLIKKAVKNKESLSLKKKIEYDQKLLNIKVYNSKVFEPAIKNNTSKKFIPLFENVDINKRYQEFVAGNYKLEGYSIYMNKINKYINIICDKDNEVLLIDCKIDMNQNEKIGAQVLKDFIDECKKYTNDNNLFDKEIKFKFITSKYMLDESAEFFLERNRNLNYEILEHPKLWRVVV